MQGAAFGLVIACAVGALVGSSLAMRAMPAHDAGARATVYAMAISEGLNCGALMALVAVPAGALLAVRRRRR